MIDFFSNFFSAVLVDNLLYFHVHLYLLGDSLPCAGCSDWNGMERQTKSPLL